MLSEASEQFHDDILIWERKAYAKKTLLIKEDVPILKMRKWYSQFYSQSEKNLSVNNQFIIENLNEFNLKKSKLKSQKK